MPLFWIMSTVFEDFKNISLTHIFFYRSRQEYTLWRNIRKSTTKAINNSRHNSEMLKIKRRKSYTKIKL